MNDMNDLNVKPVNQDDATVSYEGPAIPSLHLVPSLSTEVPQLRPPVDQERVAAAVREILVAIGEDPDREGLEETPARVARAYAEIFAGLRQDPTEHLARVFSHGGDEVVAVRDLEFHSVCEHHLLPFLGRAHIAYLPGGGQVVGLSKLARTVHVFARRPQIQERMTAEIADAVASHLQARGVTVLVEAEHMCMRMRGVRTHASTMTTVAHRGVFAANTEQRSEVLALLRSGGVVPSPPRHLTEFA